MKELGWILAGGVALVFIIGGIKGSWMKRDTVQLEGVKVSLPCSGDVIRVMEKHNRAPTVAGLAIIRGICGEGEK